MSFRAKDMFKQAYDNITEERIINDKPLTKIKCIRCASPLDSLKAALRHRCTKGEQVVQEIRRK